MKNKGFTVVELIVTFVLVMSISLFLFEIIIVLRNLYVSYGLKTELLNKQSLISYKINEDFNDKDIVDVTKCGDYCLNFIYTDNTVKRLFINKTANTFEYGDYRTTFPEGTYFGDMNIDIYISPVFDKYQNDSLISVDIPIYNDVIKEENFGIKTVYQYNSLTSNITDIVFDEKASQKGTVVLKGDSQITINSTSTYIDPGYIVLDKDGNVTEDPRLIEVVNPFDSMTTPYTVGKYDIKFNYKDIDGNILEIKTRTVTVQE